MEQEEVDYPKYGMIKNLGIKGTITRKTVNNIKHFEYKVEGLESDTLLYVGYLEKVKQLATNQINEIMIYRKKNPFYNKQISRANVVIQFCEKMIADLVHETYIGHFKDHPVIVAEIEAATKKKEE